MLSSKPLCPALTRAAVYCNIATLSALTSSKLEPWSSRTLRRWPILPANFPTPSCFTWSWTIEDKHLLHDTAFCTTDVAGATSLSRLSCKIPSPLSASQHWKRARRQQRKFTTVTDRECDAQACLASTHRTCGAHSLRHRVVRGHTLPCTWEVMLLARRQPQVCATHQARLQTSPTVSMCS